MSGKKYHPAVPDWLLCDERYQPRSDHAVYIEKTILGILGVLARMRHNTRDTVGVLGRVDPVIKLGGAVVVVLLVSLSRNILFVTCVATAALFALSTLRAGTIAAVLAVSGAAALVTGIITAPVMVMGNHENGLLLCAKVGVCACIVNMLAYTATWHRMTAALKMLFISDIFILIFDIAMKYIFILGEFSLSMLYALKLRSVGKNDRKHHSVSHMAGALFLKSKEMAEDMYAAMVCRGFDGTYTRRTRMKFTFIDGIYSAVHLVIIVCFVTFR
ncbi:MAG: energy-coupling factor transporter transmembrane protein EcfT [Spirochaetes bacterium]|nr:energy-coupling factor transporter transmembrane protein EcfT [Spirochaetota bacterium]